MDYFINETLIHLPPVADGIEVGTVSTVCHTSIANSDGEFDAYLVVREEFYPLYMLEDEDEDIRNRLYAFLVMVEKDHTSVATVSPIMVKNPFTDETEHWYGDFEENDDTFLQYYISFPNMNFTGQISFAFANVMIEVDPKIISRPRYIFVDTYKLQSDDDGVFNVVHENKTNPIVDIGFDTRSTHHNICKNTKRSKN